MEAASSFPLSPKITLPRLTTVVHRPRLDEWLEANRDKRVIFVVGQAAQGKSTVAASWASQSPLPSAWLSLDAECSYPVNLFQWLIQSLQHALEETDLLPLADYPSAGMGPREEPPPFRDWSRAIFRKTSRPFQIILDGLDRLAAGAASFGFIQVLMEELPAGGRLIAVSRSMPPLQVQRLKMDRQAAILANEQLAFTTDETRRLFQKLGTPLGSRHLRMVQELTEGWVGGLVLVSEYIKGLSHDPRQEQSLDDSLSRASFKQDVFEYMGEQVFAALPSSVRDLLVKLSLLDVIEPGFAKDFLGIEDAAQVMEDLVMRNLFVQCLESEGEGRLYRLHQLFRDFLLVRLRSETSREERLQWIFKAGALYERYGSFESAVKHYLASRAYGDAARAVEKGGMSLLKAGRTGELARWLRSLPQKLVRKNPWLLFYLCLTRRFSGVEENIGDLQEALSMFKDRKDVSGRMLCLAYLIEALIMRGRFSIPMPELISKAESELESPQSDAYSYERVSLLIQVGLAQIVSGGKPNKAFSRCMTAFSVAKELGIVPLQLNALIHAVLALSSQGAFSSAREICRRIEELFARYPITELQCFYWIIASVVHTWSGELEEASSLLKRALNQTEEHGLLYLYPLALIYTLFLESHLGEFDRTERTACLLLDISASHSNRMFSGIATLLLGVGFYFKGENRKCMETMDQAESILSSRESHGVIHLNWIKLVRSLASFHLESGEWAEIHELHEALDYFSSISDFLRMAECRLAMALLAAQKGNSSEAAAHVEAGFRIAEEKGYSYFSFTSRADALRACILALGLNVEQAVPYAVQVLSMRFGSRALPALAELESHRNPAVRSRALDTVILIRRSGLPRLRIETFGGLRVFRGETPIEDGEWERKQPKNLLRALIARGAFEVPKEALIEDLWPETDPTSGERSFKVILHRLRKTLEPSMDNTYGSSYLHLRSGLLWLDEELCTMDVLAFQSALDAAGKKEVEGDLEGALSFYEQAEKLYKGDLFPEELSIPMIDLKRDVLRDDYLQALMRIAAIHDRRSSSRKAIACLKKAIRTDPLFESAYQKLMALFFNKGMRNDALRTYEEYRKILQAELGMEPDELTTALYRKIRDSQVGAPARSS